MTSEEVICMCGYLKDDGEMLGCSTCGKWEHLACRGYFETPAGDHICHRCMNTPFSCELQNVCIKRRGFERLYFETWTYITKAKFVNALGVAELGCGVFDDFIKAEILVSSKAGRARINRELMKECANRYFEDPENLPVFPQNDPQILPIQPPLSEANKENQHEEKSILKRKISELEGLQEEIVMLKRKISELEGVQEENVRLKGVQEENVRLKGLLQEENVRLKGVQEELKGLLQEENVRLKDSSPEEDNMPNTLKKDSSSEEDNMAPDPDTLRIFIGGLIEIVGDSLDERSMQSTLDAIHQQKQIGTAGYVKNHQQVFGKSCKYHCMCGKGPLGGSGMYRHTKKEKATCHPVPVEYYTVLKDSRFLAVTAGSSQCK